MEERRERARESWRDCFRRGLHRLQDGDFSGAEQDFERAHRLAPGRAEVIFALGREMLRRGDIAEAEPLLWRAFRADPTLESAATTLARCLGVDQGRFEEAHEVLDGALPHHPESPSLEVVRAELCLSEGRVDDAEAHATLGQSLAPENSTAADAASAVLSRVSNQRGIDACSAGTDDLAVFMFKRAAALDPEWGAPHINMGIAFEKLGRWRRALAAYKLAIEIDCDNSSAYLNLGLLLSEHGETERALDSLSKALDISPNEPRAAAALAQLYAAEGSDAIAKELLRRAMAAEPNTPRALVSLGAAWQSLGESCQAEACLRRALSIDPRHVVANLCLADVLAREGRYLEAATFAELAQSIDPEEADLYLKGHSRVHSEST